MKKKTNLLLLIPEWALSFVGLVYSTGFLIVFTFLERFGLKEAGSEFFKVKYMHVGILFMMFPLITLVPTIAMYFCKLTENINDLDVDKTDMQQTNPDVKSNKEFKLSIPSMILILNTLFVFYILVIFAPPSYVMQKHYLLPALFAVPFVGLTFFHCVIPSIIKEDKVQSIHTIARWFICGGLALPLDVYALFGISDILSEMLMEGGYSFVLINMLIGYIFWRFHKRSGDITSESSRKAFWIIGACVLFSLYYLSVLTFSYRVYPYMPASKGGGDYNHSVDAVIFIKERYKKSLPIELASPTSDISTKPFKVIEETNNSIFIANPLEQGGPNEWRRLKLKTPKIYEIRRDCIVDVVYSNEPSLSKP